MKKTKFRTIFTTLLCCLLISLTAYANSAPIQMTPGDPARGIIPKGESPVTVEKEILTFNIQNLLPEENDYDIEGADVRSGSVCAQYFFTNPSTEPVTLKLAFAHGVERINSSCDVRINDQPLETQIRYTYTDGYQNFFGPDDVLKIKGDYTEDEFFYPEMPVAEYIFNFDGLPDGSNDAIFEYSIPEKVKARIIVPCSLNSSGTYKRSVKNGSCISVYVLGDDSGIDMAWSIGESRKILPENGKRTVLSEFASLIMNKIPDISGIDSYNVVVEGMNEARHFDLILSRIPEVSFDTTMWIEYEFTLSPGESAENSVRAVLAPEIFNYRKNPEFTYKYLLSPAQCWKKFGTLDVIINTPHILNDYSEEGFEATESGYTKHYESLPDGELEFSLIQGKKSSSGSGSANAGSIGTGRDSDGSEERPLGHGGAIFGVILLAVLFIGGAILALGLIIVIVIVIVNVRKKKKKEKGK